MVLNTCHNVMRSFQLPRLLLCCDQWTSHDCCMWSLALVHQGLSHVLSHDFSSVLLWSKAEHQKSRLRDMMICDNVWRYMTVWRYMLMQLPHVNQGSVFFYQDCQRNPLHFKHKYLKCWCGFLLVNLQHLGWLPLSRNPLRFFCQETCVAEVFGAPDETNLAALGCNKTPMAWCSQFLLGNVFYSSESVPRCSNLLTCVRAGTCSVSTWKVPWFAKFANS